MQHSNKSNPTRPSNLKPIAIGSLLDTQALLQQAGFGLRDSQSLPSPPLQFTPESINAMDPEKCKELLQMLTDRVSQSESADLVTYISESEFEEESTPHHPAASEQAQDELDDWEDAQLESQGSGTHSEDEQEGDSDRGVGHNSFPVETYQGGPQEVGSHPARDWATDPNRAHLRRAMGITADMESTAQERLSRKFRGEVRRLAGIDFTKTWTDLEHEGKTDDMIMSISTPLLLQVILFAPILIESWQELWKA